MSKGLEWSEVFQRPLDQALFFHGLSTMFGAGIPLVSCFDQLAEQSEGETDRTVAQDIATSLRRGQTLHKAMDSQHRVFSKLQLHLIRIGTESGMLELILQQIAIYEEKQRALVMKLKSALTYPCVIFAVSLLGLAILPTFAMGGLITALSDSGQTLPFLTRVLIWWSGLLTQPWFYLLFVVAALGLGAAAKHAWEFTKVRELVHTLLLATPVLNRFLILIATLRFTRCLCIQLRAGVNILVAVPLACDATAWEPTQNARHEILNRLRNGEALTEALESRDVFHPLLLDMVRAGEESGKLPYTLSRTVALFEQEVDYAIDVVIALLEPLMMAVLGFICAFFILGVALPLVQLLQSLS